MTHRVLICLALFAFSLSSCAQKTPTTKGKEATKEKEGTTVLYKDDLSEKEGLAKATFGAGCFWCVEAVFQEVEGVSAVISGYTGGKVQNPTYKEITTGTTGHAEVAQITYDPKVIPYEVLLDVFWTTHDPTTLNRQGADRGTQYRSAIFYHDEAQKAIAEKSKREVATKLWDDPVVTEITPLGDFYVAENYHQDFYSLNPEYGYCVAVINPKLAKLRAKFADRLKGATTTSTSKEMPFEKVVKSEQEWRKELSAEEFNVLRKKGTERPFTGELLKNKTAGTYVCNACKFPLFDSATKFKSGTGWPSFFQPLNDYCVAEESDDTYGMRRVEVLCARCDGHLGHVFEDGPKPTGLRYCINSVSLDFVAKDKEATKQ